MIKMITLYSLVKGFKLPFLGLKGKIESQRVINAQSSNIEETIEGITNSFLLKDPGLIFVALQRPEAEKFVLSLRRKGLQHPIIAGNALADEEFARNFKKYAEEKVTPGFFSDGIYTASPLLWDVADETAQLARNDYVEKYHAEPPGRVAAMSFEAAMIAAHAMKTVSIQGKMSSLNDDRQKIQTYLASRRNLNTSLPGVNGSFYFDTYGNAQKPLAIGVFEKQKLVSATVQFQPVPDIAQVDDLGHALETGEIVTIAGRFMYRTEIAYVGIDFNSIKNIDSKTSTYELDFYLWFRARSSISPWDIEFTNATKDNLSQELTLKEPIVDKTFNSLLGDIRYTAYRVKGTFKEKFDFRAYPFDMQTLAVKFRHHHLLHHRLIYVVDFVGIGADTSLAMLKKFERNKVFDTVTDWGIAQITLFQDFITKESTLGNPALFGSRPHLEFSRFNATINVKRDTFSFVTKNLLPLLFLVGISYLIMYLPFKEISLTAISGILVAVAFFHLNLANGLPVGIGYAVVLDYAFYMIYSLIIFELLLVVIGQRENIVNNDYAKKRLVLTGRIVYPLVFFTTSIIISLLYGVTFSSFTTHNTSPIIVEDKLFSTEAKTPEEAKTILTLTSWDTGNPPEIINQVFAAFYEQHPDIIIRYTPVVADWYTKMLQLQLSNHVAPDLFFLRPYSRSQSLLEMGYLESLENLPALDENFSEASKAAWRSKEGIQFGLPFMAVSHGIYYNQTLFETLGLTIPTTWEELLTTAHTLKKAGYIPFGNGIQDGWNSSELLFMNLAVNFIHGYTGRLEYDTGQRCFNDEQVVRIFQAIQALAPYLPKSPENIGYSAGRQLFLQGKAAMFIDGSWGISVYEKANLNFEWNIFPLPAPKGEDTYIVYHPDFAIGLNAASEHKAQAKLFLNWLAQPETAALFSNHVLGFFPLHRTSLNTGNKHANTFLSLNEKYSTDVRWAFPRLMDGNPNGKALMQKGTSQVILGEITPEEAADRLQNGLAEWFRPAQECLLLDAAM